MQNPMHRSWRQLLLLTPTIKELLSKPPATDSQITACGHVRAVRSFKNVGFLDISDGSIFLSLNVVFNSNDFNAQAFKVGQSVRIRGTWVESRGKQAYEIVYDGQDPNHSVEIVGHVPETYPIQKKSQTLQFLRTLPTLRHRTATLSSILRFRSTVESKLMDFFKAHDFVKVAPPLITSSDCEGAGEQFKLEPLHKTLEGFFGKDAYLTVSTQLHLEALALSLNRVWTLSPCFRAEDSHTNRHLSEFWMLEAEICYVDSVNQLTDVVEAMVRHVVASITNDIKDLSPGSLQDLLNSRYAKEEAHTLKQRWNLMLSPEPWPRVTYTEAIGLINEKRDKSLKWGDSISTEDEKWLAGTHFQSPLFVTDYPMAQKPFYMPKSASFDPEQPTVACFDLLVPEVGELVGGSLRENNHNTLVAEMEARGMRTEEMEWYLSLRQNGGVPHGGFGMGFERLIVFLGAMENIKDVSAFPRAPQLCSC